MSTHKLASPAQVLALMKEMNATKAKISEIAGRLGERVKNAVDSGNFHQAALKLAASLDRQEELKRNAFLLNFDHYRKVANWSETGHVGDLEDAAGGNAAPDQDMSDADAVDAAAGDEDGPVEKKPRKPRATKVEMEARRAIAEQAFRKVTPTREVEPATVAKVQQAGEDSGVVPIDEARELFKKRRRQEAVTQVVDREADVSDIPEDSWQQEAV